MSASTRGLVLTGTFTIDSLDWYRCLVIICNEDCYCRKYIACEQGPSESEKNLASEASETRGSL